MWPLTHACVISINRFRVFHSTIQLQHEYVEAVTMAACVLHNIIRSRNTQGSEVDCEDPTMHEVSPGSWREDSPLGKLPRHRAHRPTDAAKGQRYYLREYCTTPPRKCCLAGVQNMKVCVHSILKYKMQLHFQVNHGI